MKEPAKVYASHITSAKSEYITQALLPDVIKLLTEIRNNNVVVDAMLYNDSKDSKKQEILSRLDSQIRSVLDACNHLTKGGK